MARAARVDQRGEMCMIYVWYVLYGEDKTLNGPVFPSSSFEKGEKNGSQLTKRAKDNNKMERTLNGPVFFLLLLIREKKKKAK